MRPSRATIEPRWGDAVLSYEFDDGFGQPPACTRRKPYQDDAGGRLPFGKDEPSEVLVFAAWISSLVSRG